MGPGVHVAEPDDGSLGVLVRDHGRPVRLEHEPHGAWRDALHPLVEDRLGGDPPFFRLDALAVAELLLEPGHHPEAPVDEELDVPGARQGGWPGEEPQGPVVDVFSREDLHAGRGAVGDHADARLDGPRAEDLGLLVARTHHHGQTRGKAGLGRGGCRHLPEHGVGGKEVHHVLRLQAEGVVCEPEGVPLELFVVQGPQARDHAHGVLELPGEPLHEPPGDLHELVGLCVHPGLVVPDPEELRMLPHVRDGGGLPGKGKDRTGSHGQRGRVFVDALVQPDDGGPQGSALPVHGHEGPPLGRDADARDLPGVDGDLLHELVRHPAELRPVIVRALLRPTGVERKVGLVGSLGKSDNAPGAVKEHCPHALRARVQCNHVIPVSHGTSLMHFARFHTPAAAQGRTPGSSRRTSPRARRPSSPARPPSDAPGRQAPPRGSPFQGIIATNPRGNKAYLKTSKKASMPPHPPWHKCFDMTITLHPP